MAEDRRMTAADVAASVIAGEHGDFVREAVALVARELMEAEVTAEVGAELGEVSDTRVTHRNGYRPRPWETRVGEIELLIPRKRQGPAYFPSFLEPRRRSEQAIVAVVLEAYVNGVSTRKVDRLVEQLGIGGMTKDRVSALCRGLDEQVEVFRQRPLARAYPYLWLDAKHVKVRSGGHVRSKALVVAYAVHETGVREVIGLDIGEVESGGFWIEFLRSLRARGLDGVQLRSLIITRGSSKRSRRCWPARGSGARCTSCATCTPTAAATNAGWSPPPCAKCSTPRTTSRHESASGTSSNACNPSPRRSASCSRTPKRT